MKEMPNNEAMAQIEAKLSRPGARLEDPVGPPDSHRIEPENVGLTPRKHSGGWARVIAYFGLTAVSLAVLAALAIIFYLWSVTRELPSVEALQNYAPPVTTRVYAG